MKAEMHNVSFWVSETNPEKLQLLLNRGLKKSGFNVLKFIDYHFEPFGFTGLWLLSESHLAVHTFPEENRTYIELSSCVAAPYYSFLKYINKAI